MAQVIDTLSVLIEADSRGLETQLKQATNSVSSFVKEINEGTVNWKSIFTKSLSPTLITGVASTVALAISKALSMQNAVSSIASAMGQNMNQTSAAVSSFALQTGAATITSAEDIAKAYGIANKILQNEAQAQAVATIAAQTAVNTGQDLYEVTTQFAQVLKSQGITSVRETEKTLNELAFASERSAMSWNEFMQVVLSTSAQIKGKVNFTEWINSISALSQQSGVTSSQVAESFSAMAEAINNPLDKVNLLAGGFGGVLEKINKVGIIGALDSISDKVKSSGMIATELAQAYRLSSQAILLLKNTSHPTFVEADRDAKELSKSLMTQKEILDNNKTSTQSLKGEWERLVSSMVTFLDKTSVFDSFQKVLGGIASTIEVISAGIGEMGDRWKEFNTTGGIPDALKDILSYMPAKHTEAAVNSRVIDSVRSTLGSSIDNSEFSAFSSRASSRGLDMSDILQILSGKGQNLSSYANFRNTFNITGSDSQLTADEIVKQLVNQFNTNS